MAQCKEKAKLPQQIFSLTVPTGGGKTFSSMAFALEHAVTHNIQRIIYAIPFTSIIEQNAKVFQEALGQEYVLEHHCNYKEPDSSEERIYNRSRGLASENWDVPIVVTTNVQFFESLFSNKTSRCRKLHNIARSVIVLDEAQAIPTEYLEPCIAVLRELVENYGCTVLLCTATQPAFDDSNSLRMAFPEVREIVDAPENVFKELRRTEVNFIGKLTDCELANASQKNGKFCVSFPLNLMPERFLNCSKKKRDFFIFLPTCTRCIEDEYWKTFEQLKEKKTAASFRHLLLKPVWISIFQLFIVPWQVLTPSLRLLVVATGKVGWKRLGKCMCLKKKNRRHAVAETLYYQSR